MHLIPWWAWTIGAAALALAELHVPGSYLVWIALGAAVTAAADAAWELSLSAQVGVFAGASALSCVGGYFVYRRTIQDRRLDETIPLNQRSLAMVGARGIVSAAFEAGRGKVRLGDSVWLAEGPDLAEGTPVIVTAVTGMRVHVEELAAKPPS
jgi:membrane protein implicated in regulation of membrane protease activity